MAARLTITFTKLERGSSWEARRHTGGRFGHGFQPIGKGVIPHDLAHFAVEAHLGIDDGVWGLLARGATYRRGTDARRTRPGRALVRDNRAALHRAEAIGNAHHAAWVAGEPTPVAPLFDHLAQEWRALPKGGSLEVAWPYSRTTPPSAATTR